MADREVEAQLDAFERHLAAGERGRAYRAVRDAWRRLRAEPLAQLVELAAQRLRAPEPIAGKTQKARQLAWIERARARDPLDLPMLLDELAEPVAAAQAAAVAARLDELFGHADDPTLIDALCTTLWAPGGWSTWGKVHTRLFKLLEATGDPRAVARLDAVIEDAHANPDSRPTTVQRSIVERAPLVRARIAERFPSGAPTIDEALGDRIAKLAKLLDAPLPPARPERVAEPPSEAKLLAAILANPDDDERRAVYADLLQERGDPRGQFIALQLAAQQNPESAAAAKALLAKHRGVWIGRLAQVVVSSSVEFERGFPVACSTDVRRQVLADTAFDLPEWGTVERISFRRFARLSPTMHALQEALGVPEPALAELAHTELPRLRVLGVVPNVSRSRTQLVVDKAPRGRGLLALLEPAGLPALRELRLDLAPREWLDALHSRGPDGYAWLFERPIGQQLERVVINIGGLDWENSPIVDWAVFLDRVEPPLSSIVLEAGTAKVVLTRAEGRVSAGVSVPGHDRLPPWVTRELDGVQRALADAAVEWVGWIRE